MIISRDMRIDIKIAVGTGENNSGNICQRTSTIQKKSFDAARCWQQKSEDELRLYGTTLKSFSHVRR